jgi:hypothetical protein
MSKKNERKKNELRKVPERIVRITMDNSLPGGQTPAGHIKREPLTSLSLWSEQAVSQAMK